MEIINMYFNEYTKTDDAYLKKYYKTNISSMVVNKKNSEIILSNWDRIVEIVLAIDFIDNFDVDNLKKDIESKYHLQQLIDNKQANK